MKKILLLVLSLVFVFGLNAQNFTEDFQTVTVDENVSLDGWTNAAVEGTRVFIGKYYAGDDNYYAQMSAFNSAETSEIVWLITPALNVTASSVLTFETKLAYMVHDPAYVGISTDFSGDASTATWTELTYTHATAPSDGYGEWTPSGDIDLSAYAGQIHIGFKYTGGDPGQTTTFQIDNVSVTNSTVAIKENVKTRLSAYPNPVVDVLNFSVNTNVKVYNISGVELLNETNVNTVDFSNLEAGIYFVQFETVEGVSTQKFVKK